MDFFIETLINFTMVLTRISAFFLVAPVFGWKTIPVRTKVALTVLMSVFFAMISPPMANSADIKPIQAVILLSNEAIYGLALGLITVLIFTVVRFAGRIIERQMGLAMASVLNPLTGEDAQPLGMLLEMIFVLIFFSVNGHHLLLSVISRSYEAFPAGTIPTIPVLVEGIVRASSTLLMAGLRLAAPILAAFMLLMVTLAVLARVAPETNILFVSLPLRVGLGLILAGLFVPLVNSFVSEFADWIGKLLPL